VDIVDLDSADGPKTSPAGAELAPVQARSPKETAAPQPAGKKAGKKGKKEKRKPLYSQVLDS